MWDFVRKNQEPWRSIWAIVGTSVLFAGVAQYLRLESADESPLFFVLDAETTFDPYVIGLAVQEILFPLALIALQLNTPFPAFCHQHKWYTQKTGKRR